MAAHLKELRAYGVALFRTSPQGVVELLVLKHRRWWWDLPKGHVKSRDNGDPMATAQRELQEETGIAVGQFDVLPGFEVEQPGYKTRGKWKVNTFFGAVLTDHEAEVVVSREHKGFAWLPIHPALTALVLDNAAGVTLTEALGSSPDTAPFFKRTKPPTHYNHEMLKVVLEHAFDAWGQYFPEAAVDSDEEA